MMFRSLYACTLLDDGLITKKAEEGVMDSVYLYLRCRLGRGKAKSEGIHTFFL